MDIDEIIRTRSIRDVLVGVDTSRNWFVCPLPSHIHAHNTPSFSIYIGRNGYERFKCHGNCGADGDVIDLVGYMNIPGYDSRDGEMVRKAYEILSGDYKVNVQIPVVERKIIETNAWMEYMPPSQEVLDYALSRGIYNDTALKFKLGQLANFMTIPCFEEGELFAIKMRNILDKVGHLPEWRQVRFSQRKYSRAGIFNLDKVSYSLEPVVIVKAEIPAMILDQYGFLACAPTWGEGACASAWRIDDPTKSRMFDYRKYFLASPRVTVIADNDETGIAAAKMRARIVHGTVRYPPEKYKDVDAWIIDNPVEAIDTLTEWIWN